MCTARVALVVTLLLSLASLAQADQIGFAGLYDPSLWTFTGSGSVDISGAPANVVIRGENGAEALGYWVTIAPASGLISFDWSYTTADEGPEYDPAGWAVNSTYGQLSDNSGANTQSGSASFSVTAGDVFGFWTYADECCGVSELTISNFSAPDGGAVPEPATWLLTGLPLIVVGLRRRAG